MNKRRAADLLQRGDTHPSAINDILIHFYPDWIMWEPETIDSAIRSLTEQGSVDFLIQHKVGAIQTIHNNEGAWEDWEVFNWVNQPFNDLLANFQYAKKPSIGELMITVRTIERLRKREYSDEVKSFMAAACLDAGVLFVPPPLDLVQDILDIVEYRCSACGNVDLITGNNVCDFCGAPEASLIKTYKYYDWKRVRDRWETIKDMDITRLTLYENVEDINIAKVAAALLSLNEREKQLKEELAYVT